MSNSNNPSLDQIWHDMNVPSYSQAPIQEAREFRPKKSKRKGKRKLSDKDIGAIEQVNSSYEIDNIFNSILKEMADTAELGSSDDVFDGEEDNVFDAGDDFDDGEMISISELKNMTLQEIVDLISGDEDAFDDDDGFEDEGDDFDFNDEVDEDDEIPAESYGFEGGEGNPKGSQGNYDGRARRQAKTTHIKDNGDAKVNDSQDTGYDPDDVEGREGSEHGAQGNYDGRARSQPKTNHVKPNGDADFGKAKTGKKISSGKKDKNFF